MGCSSVSRGFSITNQAMHLKHEKGGKTLQMHSRLIRIVYRHESTTSIDSPSVQRLMPIVPKMERRVE